MDKNTDSGSNTIFLGRRLYSVMIALGAMILVAVLVVFYGLYETARNNNAEQLTIISRVKTTELGRWVDEKTRYLAQPADSYIAMHYSSWLAHGSNDPLLRRTLVEQVQQGKNNASDIVAAGFYDLNAKLRFSTDDALLAETQDYSAAFQQSLQQGHPLLLDMHMLGPQGSNSGRVVFNVLVPLLVTRHDKPLPIGFLLYQLDPAISLFQLLNQWPVTSSSGETLLLRVEGKDIVYLTPLVERNAAPLTLHLPLDSPDLLAAKALQRTPGEIIYAHDYRGEAVIGLMSVIPSMNWYLITKVGVKEVFAEARREAYVLGGAILLLLCMMGILGWLLQRPERRRQQAELLTSFTARRRAEDHFRKLVEFASEGIAVSNAQGLITFANPRLHEMLGFSSGGLMGQDPEELLDEVSLVEFRARLAELNQGGGNDSFHSQWRLRHKDGHWRDVWISAAPTKDLAGAYDGSIIMVTDISALKDAERALRQSEEQFRTIFDSVAEAIFIHDPASGAILDVNQRACELYGYSSEEIRKISVADISSGEPPYTQDEVIAKLQLPIAESQTFQWHARRKDGSLFWVEVAIREAVIGGEKRLLVGVHDISRRRAQEQIVAEALAQQRDLNRKLEEAHGQLLQSEKMASIGQLAAGVAHELNNPISFVYSNLGTLGDYLRDIFAVFSAYEEAEKQGSNPEALAAVVKLKQEKDFAFLRQDTFDLMEESRDGLNRVRKIVQDLKDFSRVGETNWQWADLHKGLDSTLNIAWNELKYKCKVVKQYGALPDVYCLPSQLNQVFMNLLVNASQAIEDQGEVTISSGVGTDAAGQAEVWIAISDTGKGIAADNLNRIFEPFFTTKPVGKGTGLGLSLSYGIVRKHHGRIEVDSVEGKGTTFTIHLPVQPAVEPAVEDNQTR